jgi:putative membrane protein
MSSETKKGKNGLEMRGGTAMERVGMSEEAISVELSMRRTGLSFQRTRMSADRTLMSVMRTSLSLISFGFTIFQFFHSLKQGGSVTEGSAESARNFGLSLVVLGVGMLVAGLVYQVRFMTELRNERRQMVEEGLVHGDLSYPISMTFITACLLLILGVIAFFSMLMKSGPFG